jgi:hypothetical protein
MTDTTEQLRDRLRELEMDAVLIRGRIEELREIIGLLEPWSGPRRGRPRKPAAAAITALRVTGGEHQPETDTEDSAA